MLVGTIPQTFLILLARFIQQKKTKWVWFKMMRTTQSVKLTIFYKYFSYISSLKTDIISLWCKNLSHLQVQIWQEKVCYTET